MWHITNKDSQTREKEKEGVVGELENMAYYKQGLTNWRGERGKSRLVLVSLETWHITNENSQTKGEKEGEAGW